MAQPNKKLTQIYPALIAHRGAGKEVPENTLAAFRYGSEQGFTMFECDVKFSQDRELFLLHDSTLMRTTNGKGDAKECSWAELSKLDAGSWHSARYTGEPLARFEGVVDFILDNHYRLDVEIKPNPGEAFETGKAVAQFLLKKSYQRLENCIEERLHDPIETLFAQLYDLALPMPTINSIKKQFMLSSFEVDALKGAKAVAPQFPRALLLDDWSKGENAILDILNELECEGIITNYKILSPEFIAQCHYNGRFVMVYTANDPMEIERLFKIGVDTVITDNMSLESDTYESLRQSIDI